MADIVNLRTRRKQAARDAARTEAGARAAKHGLSKTEKTLAKARVEKAERDLEAHKRDPESP